MAQHYWPEAGEIEALRAQLSDQDSSDAPDDMLSRFLRADKGNQEAVWRYWSNGTFVQRPPEWGTPTYTPPTALKRSENPFRCTHSAKGPHRRAALAGPAPWQGAGFCGNIPSVRHPLSRVSDQIATLAKDHSSDQLGRPGATAEHCLQALHRHKDGHDPVCTTAVLEHSCAGLAPPPCGRPCHCGGAHGPVCTTAVLEHSCAGLAPPHCTACRPYTVTRTATVSYTHLTLPTKA